MGKGSLLGLLGICRKAGRIKLGFDPVLESLNEGACLLIFTSDVSPKTKERMLKKSAGFQIDSITITEASDDVWYALGKRVAVMAVTDRGLAKKAVELHEAALSRPTENHDEEDTDL